MATKKVNKDNAKTRYDAKNPTVSFRVSIEEYERLDTLRKNGMSFREVVLTGAGMIEKDRANEKIVRAVLKRRIEEAARIEALKKIWLGNCPRCGKSMLWNLTDSTQRKQLVEAVKQAGYYHARCPE